MLIHLESRNCVTTPEELDFLAQRCYQSKKYVMPGCEHQLKSRTRLKNRSKGFFNGITRRYECENCYKEFDSELRMKQHIASPIHDSNSYRCPGCGVAFVTLSGLVQHVESASCHETIQRGSGSIGKMLHYLQVALRSDNSEPDG